ncbi:MAG: hypothetical protein J5I93_12740 [Pirellulaceae bacterium]|nr:hypothetical protein [Pirellulaceae bacterium]
MNPGLEHKDELYFERGGPAHRLAYQLCQQLGIGHSVYARIIGFLAITWCPLLLFAMIEGRALGSEPEGSLLLDFGTYARFFLGIPLLIIAEPLVGPRLRAAGLQFVQGGYLRHEDYPEFDRAILSAAKWRESAWAELIIFAIAVAGAWLFTAETIAGEPIATWRSPGVTPSGTRIWMTALWYRLVAVPVLQFFWYRWLWRLFVWSRFLWTVSRLDLRLIGTHADQAGGLGFLGVTHTSLGVFAFALSCVMSGEAAFLLLFQGASIEVFKVPYIVLLLTIELLFLGPLLVFAPILIRTRLAWLRDYSTLLCQYNRAFHEKWIQGKASPDEPLLGSADIQSLADLGNSFEYIRNMKVVPFSLRVMIQLAVVASLPCVPLILLVMPLNEILSLLSNAVF